jgi:CheY-like chemotaxis protein
MRVALRDDAPAPRPARHRDGRSSASSPVKEFLSVFQVWLPSVETPADAAHLPVPKEDSSGPDVILMADDQEAVRRTAQVLLEAHGYTTLTAASGDGDLEILPDSKAVIHAVVLDLRLPVMDGEETLIQIKLLRPDLPVLLTGSNRQSHEGVIGVGHWPSLPPGP